MPIQTYRWLAVSAVLVAGLCTTVMNWRFAFQLALNQFDAYVWATFSVALDICKWMMLQFAALAWRRHKQRAMAALVIWLVATCYSFAAALGFAATNRDATAAERRLQADIHNTLQTMRRSPRWQSSAACAHPTTKQSRDFCETYRAMERKLTRLPQHDDPQSELIARLSGLSQGQSSLILAVSLALACELVSALGLFAIASVSLQSSQLGSQPGSRPSEEPDHAQAPRSHTTVAQRTVSTHLGPPRWRPRQSN